MNIKDTCYALSKNSTREILVLYSTNLLDNSSDIHLILYGIIGSDRLIIRGLCVEGKTYMQELSQCNLQQRWAMVS